jgi:hypothetical protein
MTLEERIDEHCRRLGLDGCLAVRRSHPELPPCHTLSAPALPDGLPPFAAALARAATQSLDAESIRALFDWTAQRPLEQAMLARDLLASTFVNDLERERLRQHAGRFAELATAPPPLALWLDADEVWGALAAAAADLDDDELDRRVSEYDLAALAQVFRRGRGAALLTEKVTRGWLDWCAVLTQAHFPIWASAVAGLLARESGNATALALWSDVAGDDSLRYPDRLDEDVPSSAFGPARERVPPADLRLIQLALRLRRASHGAPPSVVEELLQVPLPDGGLDASMRVLAARVEASVGVGREEPMLSTLTRHAAKQPSWRYGRWAGLLGMVAAGRLPGADLLQVVDEHWSMFGGSRALYYDLGNATKDDDLFQPLVHRLLGDLEARPQVGDLWVAFAMCFALDDELEARARDQVLGRLRAQLPPHSSL